MSGVGAICAYEPCRRMAGIGLLVCLPDRALVVVTLADIPTIYEDLLIPSRSPRTSSLNANKPEPAAVLSDRARWEREAIVHCLHIWITVLYSRRRVSQPPGREDVAARSVVVKRHADWLLNSEHGIADQLVHDMYGISDARAVAYPDRGGVRVPCANCGERVRLDPSMEIIRCNCGESGTLAQWQERVAPQIGVVASARDLVPWLLIEHRQVVSEEMIRQWATRGDIDRQGRDEKSRTLYDPIQVAAVAVTRRGNRKWA